MGGNSPIVIDKTKSLLSESLESGKFMTNLISGNQMFSGAGFKTNC